MSEEKVSERRKSIPDIGDGQFIVVISKYAVQIEPQVRQLLQESGVKVVKRVRERLSESRANSMIISRRQNEINRRTALLQQRKLDEEKEADGESVSSLPPGEEGKEDDAQESKLEEKEQKCEEEGVLDDSSEQSPSDESLDENLCLSVNDEEVDLLAKSFACTGQEYIVSFLCEGESMSLCRKAFATPSWQEKMQEAGVFDHPLLKESEATSEEKEDSLSEETPESSLKLAFRSMLIWCGASHSENQLFYPFLFFPKQLNDSDLSLLKNKALSSKKSTMVSMEQLIRFVFPENLQHPLSTGRLIVFGTYGPLDHNSNLCSGFLGTHVVRKHELQAMVKQIDTEDLLEIFAQGEVLTSEVQLEVLRQAGEDLRSVPQLTKKEVQKLFEDVPRNSKDQLCFHKMQEVILQYRKKRIADLKRISVVGTAQPSARTRKEYSKDELLAIRKHEKALYAASTAARKPRPKIKDSQRFSVVTNMLNRNTHKITTIEQKNHPSLVHNVRILREHVYMPVSGLRLHTGGYGRGVTAVSD